jgi:hypothetical protein
VFGDMQEIVGRLGVPQLVQVREPRHPPHEVPECDRVIAGRRGNDHGAVERIAVGEHQRRNAVRSIAGDRLLMFLAYFVERRVVGDRAVDKRWIEAGFRDHLCVHFGNVRLDAVVEERVANRRVPVIERVVAELTTDQRADAHLAEAVRPRAFPRVALAGDKVHLFQREEPPRDVERPLLSDRANPA